MKRTIYLLSTALLVMAGTWACQKEDPMLFSNVNRISLKDSLTQTHTFVYDDESVSSYTYYIQVNTIGDVVDYDRTVMLTQLPEYDVTYTYDGEGNVTDTVYTEIPNMAVPDKHYTSFDKEAARSQWIVKANSNTAMIPITLLRDASLKNNVIRLRVGLVATDDFQLGETKAREKTIVFSDQLLKPAFWINNFAATYSIGPWSVVKHQFMIDVSGEKIDQEWYDTKYSLQNAGTYYLNLFARALDKFNNDPENIASGRAPLLDENNLIVRFGNQ